MRTQAHKDGMSVKAYAGTTGVLLAMNIEPALRQGLLGFALERLAKTTGKKEFLTGMLHFPGMPHTDGEPIPTNQAPIQKFRWSDYRVYPDSHYTYTVHPVYGEPGNLVIKAGPTAEVKTASSRHGEHRVLFNRAAAASQAFSRKFSQIEAALNAELKKAKAENRKPEFELPPAALKWLSRGVVEQIIDFIERAKDATWALDIAIYEYELSEIIEAVEAAYARGVKVRVVYHAREGDEQTAVNEKHLVGLPETAKRGRLTDKICHQKFIVLSKVTDGKRTPRAVLCGSANFTENGVYRQGNVVHVVARADVSRQYLDLFEVLFRGDTKTATRKYISEHNPFGDPQPLFAGFSPRSGRGDLKAFIHDAGNATRDVLFCTTFDLYDDLETALLGRPHDLILRYGLQNSRSKITGFHADRSAAFSATAMLSKGLEGFLKESTHGQRGNILIHTKLIVIDFTSDQPIVISGSHNFSASASGGNDENYLILRGNTDVADSYGCELMRLYDHYRFRFVAKIKAQNGQEQEAPKLTPDDSWTIPYFKVGSLKMRDRLRFAGEGL
ncbi:MAG: phospholipase D-like domain-containing protein [Nitrospiraceae bacterium]